VDISVRTSSLPKLYTLVMLLFFVLMLLEYSGLFSQKKSLEMKYIDVLHKRLDTRIKQQKLLFYENKIF